MDYLNNVRLMIADQRMPVSDNGTTVVCYKPLVKSIHDYYPFGWEKQLTTVTPYPYNYQRQLFDKDLGWQYYRYRNYDPQVARFYQVEQEIELYGNRSKYSYVFNNPVISVNVLGLDTFVYEKDKNGKWILKKVISSDDELCIATRRKAEYVKFIVRDDPVNVIKDEVVALKRVVGRWLIRVQLKNKLVNSSWYELEGYSVDSVWLVSTGRIELSYIDLNMLMGIK